jgi:hypothetical protein
MHDTKHIAALFIVVVFFVVLLSTSVTAHMIMNPARIKYVCSDFLYYKDALSAYKKGATYLDGDKDGIPCEELYNKEH